MDKVTCRFCQHEWTPRVEIPLKCPRCWKHDPTKSEPVEAS